MTDLSTPQQSTSQPPFVKGVVKWFNDQNGYGFIKGIDNDERDYFVHITDLNPKFNSVKPCLYTGEYVEFQVASNGFGDDGIERKKATSVQGINGGCLLCDHGEISFRSYSRVGFAAQQQTQTDAAELKETGEI